MLPKSVSSHRRSANLSDVGLYLAFLGTQVGAWLCKKVSGENLQGVFCCFAYCRQHPDDYEIHLTDFAKLLGRNRLYPLDSNKN